ncbi:hypothetical protein C2845_PM04G12950 [Panicum miliaceum]|uniref:RNase H type-1 domain-containing protein n=1 Tax=Panicum miliaceum TaxID=4540 RepID=A0A3L6QV36_PANMI|nr:hypothetical protein C2845_PM04G12950 [Panicum miliaceum]
MVCDLYVRGTRVWDEEVVRNSIMLLEAEEVLKIRPGSNMPTDVVARAFEKNGMYSCPVARRFWDEVRKFSGVTVPKLHPSTWAMDVLQADVCSPSVAAMVICGAWTLWTARNVRRHGRKVWEPGATVRYISAMLQDPASLKMPAKPNRPSASMVWSRPDEGWMKVNSDAAFDAATGKGSAGVVIRDHDGVVLAAATRWLGSVKDVLTAEAMAAKEGLELAVECGVDKAVLEVDCSELTKVLESSDGVRTSIGGLCFDITELSRSFSEFKLYWVRRDANSVACDCACVGSDTECSQF